MPVRLLNPTPLLALALPGGREPYALFFSSQLANYHQRGAPVMAPTVPDLPGEAPLIVHELLACLPPPLHPRPHEGRASACLAHHPVLVPRTVRDT